MALNVTMSPLPVRIVTVLPFWFATARSALPLPLKLPIKMEVGAVPVAGLAATAVNVPFPLPERSTPC